MKRQTDPDPPVRMPNGSEVYPVATLKDDCGGVSHIIVDDGCYVLINGSVEGRFTESLNWFDEAVEAVKGLPRPSEAKRTILSRMETEQNA